MSFFRAKKQPSRESVKKISYGEDSRRRREDFANELRKQKKELELAARRPKVTPGLFGSEIELKIKQLPALVSGVNGDDQEMQLRCVTELRKLLAIERNPPIQQVVNTGVVRRLVQLLLSSHPKIQFESAWVLTNIASGTSQHTRFVIENDAIRIFIRLLASPNEEVREQAVWALGNIAGDSADYRDLVLRSGIMQPLLSLCQPMARLSTLRTAAWALANLCRGKKPEPPFEFIFPAIPVLAKLIHARDEEVLSDTCWALSYISDDSTPNNRKIQSVLMQPGVGRRLVELLTHKSDNVKTPALRTVGNIITGDDSQTQAMIDADVLPCLLSLLVNPKRSIRKEACWTISNITAGTPIQIEAVIRANLIPLVISTLRQEQFDVQKEAAWVISNATTGGKPTQLRYLADQGAVAALCDILKCNDPKIILVCLDALENILKVGQRDADQEGGDNKYAVRVEECGGLDTLEYLQRHGNDEVYDKAVKMIQVYFGEAGEAGDDAMEPQVGFNGQFSFGSKMGEEIAPGSFDFSSSAFG